MPTSKNRSIRGNEGGISLGSCLIVSAHAWRCALSIVHARRRDLRLIRGFAENELPSEQASENAAALFTGHSPPDAISDNGSRAPTGRVAVLYRRRRAWLIWDSPSHRSKEPDGQHSRLASSMEVTPRRAGPRDNRDGPRPKTTSDPNLFP